MKTGPGNPALITSEDDYDRVREGQGPLPVALQAISVEQNPDWS